MAHCRSLLRLGLFPDTTNVLFRLRTVRSAISCFVQVAAWGGYVFIINIIPIHVLALLITGRYSSRVYVAYSTFYLLGTLLAMQVSFVGFQPVYSSEHMVGTPIAVAPFCFTCLPTIGL